MQYEVGPIRPPSESSSLLVRVSRNCPWNRCTFCPVYKCERFSLRSADDVVADIEVMANIAERVRGISREMGCEGEITSAVIRRLLWEPDGSAALQVATFLAQGGTSAFLQDADSLVMPPEDLVAVITTLKKTLSFDHSCDQLRAQAARWSGARRSSSRACTRPASRAFTSVSSRATTRCCASPKRA
jgi:hypothetical protein